MGTKKKTLEFSVNNCGQEQKIMSADKVIKVGDTFLEVRLIETRKWRGEGWTKPMPRARFVRPTKENIHYLVSREDLIKMINKEHGNNKV